MNAPELERDGIVTRIKHPPSPLEKLLNFRVTEGHIATMTETKLIWRDAIASSHLAVWAAPGNAGKTAIAKFAAGELSASGYRVFFCQEDAAAGDLPALFDHAKAHRYVLLNSTLTGTEPGDQVRVLREMVRGGEDIANVVLFFDTLKKYADLMSKGGTREFFRLMRALTQRGATIVLLGHTNKHRGPDGRLVFEGVGDIRNDVDELFYVESTDKDAHGVATITMSPDKVRSLVVPLTFTLDTTSMQLHPADRVVNVSAIARREQQMREDAELIAAIKDLLSAGGMNKSALIDAVKAGTGVGKRTAAAVVDRYLGADRGPGVLWLETHIRANNVRHLSLPPDEVRPLENGRSGETGETEH